MSPDPRFPFPSYPKGWFAVAFSDDVGRGEVVYLADSPLFRGFWADGQLLFANAVFGMEAW